MELGGLQWHTEPSRLVTNMFLVCTYFLLFIPFRFFFLTDIVKKKCCTVGTVSKSKRKIVERSNIDTLNTKKYMIDHFPGMVQVLQITSGGAKLVL